MIEQLSALEHEQCRELLLALGNPRPIVIGIEGGPCSGKTTLAELLRQTESSRPIVVLPEAATEHILRLTRQGIGVDELAATNRAAYLRFERDVLATIVTNIEQARQLYAGTDAIIVADRCDIGAYLDPEEYTRVLATLGQAAPPMLTMVDKVVYLPSVSRTQPDTYDSLRATNPARLETTEVAVDVCRANLAAVGRHPELHVSWNKTYEERMVQLVDWIQQPERETELKLRPKTFSANPEQLIADGEILARHAITQSYHEFEGMRFRLRKTTTERREVLYSFTVKTGRGVIRHETQRTITPEQFAVLKGCPQTGETLRKQRTTVLLDEPDGTRRQWGIDHYYDRRLPEWNLEADIIDDEDARRVINLYGDYTLAEESAEELARLLGEVA